MFKFLKKIGKREYIHSVQQYVAMKNYESKKFIIACELCYTVNWKESSVQT